MDRFYPTLTRYFPSFVDHHIFSTISSRIGHSSIIPDVLSDHFFLPAIDLQKDHNSYNDGARVIRMCEFIGVIKDLKEDTFLHNEDRVNESVLKGSMSSRASLQQVMALLMKRRQSERHS